MKAEEMLKGTPEWGIVVGELLSFLVQAGRVSSSPSIPASRVRTQTKMSALTLELPLLTVETSGQYSPVLMNQRG